MPDEAGHGLHLHPTDEDLSVGAPVLHPTDEDLSVGAPVLHPTDEDLSVGAPVPGLFSCDLWRGLLAAARLVMALRAAFSIFLFLQDVSLDCVGNAGTEGLTEGLEAEGLTD